MPPALTRRGILAGSSLIADAGASRAAPRQLGGTDPGRANFTVGLFTDLPGTTILAGADLIETMGFNRVGVGAARYALDPDQGSNVASAIRQKSLNGRWFKLCEDEISLTMVGAMGDGVSDDTAAIAAAGALGRSLFVPAGRYTVSADLALAARVTFDVGAVMKASNALVTFNAGIEAGIHQIFDCRGAGAVVINPRFQPVGHPEWWGAVTGEAAFDCQPALAACFAAVQTTQLLAADYYVHSTPQFHHSDKNLLGVGAGGTNIGIGVAGAFPHGETGVTRIILTGIAVRTDLVFQIGYSRAQLGVPADNGAIMRNSIVRDILFARDCSVYRANPAKTADPETSVWGVAVTFMSGCLIERLKSFDSPVGYRYEGCVTTTIRDCNAAIASPPSDGANKFFVGHLVGGYIVNYGYVGANASIYLDHCTSFDAPAGFTTTWGMRVYGAFADTFIHKFEDARHDIGLEFDGRGANGAVMTIAGSQQDVKASDIVCDGNSRHSLYIHDTNDWCSIMLHEPYMAGTSAVTYACTLTNVAGVVEMVMGYILEGGNNGLLATNTNGLSIRGTLIRDSANPVVLKNVGYSLIEPRVFNLANPAINAVSLIGSFRNIVRPQITEAPNLLTYGVSLDSTSTYNHVDASMVQFDQMAAPSNATLKVRFNGADASPGGAGNAAFLAAHNVLNGVSA